MTPEQKLKHLILDRMAAMTKTPLPEITSENIDDLYEQEESSADGDFYDAREEIRASGVETHLDCDWSRHYESAAVAMEYFDGSWVGWTYWYGGGKHGEPQAVEWLGFAYDVAVTEEKKLMTVRTFKKQKENER